jgi:hypothetical protein
MTWLARHPVLPACALGSQGETRFLRKLSSQGEMRGGVLRCLSRHRHYRTCPSIREIGYHPCIDTSATMMPLLRKGVLVE